MARYSQLVGSKVDVTYRAGDVILPGTGTLAADSGKSVFLEQHYQQKGNLKTFRWEIPYTCIMQLHECPEGPSPSASSPAKWEAPADAQFERGALRFKDRTA